MQAQNVDVESLSADICCVVFGRAQARLRDGLFFSWNLQARSIKGMAGLLPRIRYLHYIKPRNNPKHDV